MTNEEFANMINDNPQPCMSSLGAAINAVDQALGTADMDFEMPLDFCHSGDIVQGGFVTGMLDAATTMAGFASVGQFCILNTLEIKVSFLAPSRAGRFNAKARVVRGGKSITFMDAELFNSDGELTATATTTAKLVLQKP